MLLQKWKEFLKIQRIVQLNIIYGYKYITMDYEKHEVKGYTKKYKNVKGKTKETTSKSIYLGTSTIFDTGDDVIVIANKDFTKLSTTEDRVDVAEFEDKIKSRDATITELTDKVDALQTELNNTKNIVIMLQNKENYLEKIVLKYESFDLIDRIKKTNPKDTINVSDNYELIYSDNIDADDF